MHASGPLSGVTVIDLTRVLAGPYCTMLLADLGARVIKVEIPGKGDDSRHYGPFINGKSAYFMSLNRGKESITLNLKSAEGKARFLELTRNADVLVENFRPGAMEKLGLGYEALSQINPRLIFASSSGFGQTGPYRDKPAYDLVAQAMGGLMSITGHAGQPPARVGTSVADITAGLFLANGIQAALYHREKTGKGERVDVAMLDCQVAILENAIARYFALAEVPQPLGARHPSITPFDCFDTQDKPIVICAGNDALFAKLCAVVEAPEFAQDPRFATNHARTENHAALKSELEGCLRTHSAAYWLEKLEAAGIPCAPIHTVADVVHDPHIKARNMVISTSDPVAGTVRMAGNPIKLSGFPDPAERAPAPELKEAEQVFTQ